VIDRIIANKGNVKEHAKQVQLVRDLSDTMLNGSLCALGGMTPYPVLSAINNFGEDFGLENKGLENKGLENKGLEVKKVTA
jgi:formate dehydrogenase iron-sulfur subunit